VEQLFGHTGNSYVKVVEMSDDEVVVELHREHWLCTVQCIVFEMLSPHVTDGLVAAART
jgi:hypothetical protein